MRRYKASKTYTWSPGIGYIAGLIASDGCLYKDGRHINLTSKDIDQLETFRAILNLTGTVKSKLNGFGGVGYYIQFSDVALYDFLYNAGIEPAKSKTMKSIKIPDEFYPDFLRGYFDGDGSIYGFWDKRWKNSLMYYTTFASASPPFLEWLYDQNLRLANVVSGKINPTTRAFALKYAKADSRTLFEFMYYSPGLPALARKHGKFIDFFQQDPYAVKELDARVVKLVNT